MKALLRFAIGFGVAVLGLAGLMGGLFFTLLICHLLIGSSELATVAGLVVFCGLVAGVISAFVR